MPNNHETQEPEFYPLERLLIAGPLADVLPLAARAQSAAHEVTLLLPDEEIESAGNKFRVLQAGEAVGAEDFDAALELHCVNLEGKAETLFFLEDTLAETVPIFTLTMAISLGELTHEMLMAERVVGISMLPPFDALKLVELMGNSETDPRALMMAESFFSSLGIKTARVADAPGGVLARSVCCMINEAAFALQERTTTAEEIDRASRLGAGWPVGILTWGDRIGLEKVLAVMDGLYAEYKEDRFRVAPLLKRMIRAGQTGVRSGRGFFSY